MGSRNKGELEGFGDRETTCRITRQSPYNISNAITRLVKQLRWSTT